MGLNRTPKFRKEREKEEHQKGLRDPSGWGEALAADCLEVSLEAGRAAAL